MHSLLTFLNLGKFHPNHIVPVTQGFLMAVDVIDMLDGEIK